MSRAGRYAAWLLLLTGIALAVTGAGADVLLGGSPGLSTPQLMLLTAGVGLIVSGMVLLQPRSQAFLKRHLRRLLIGSALTMLVMTFVFEIVLAVVGFKPRYALDVPATFITPVAWWLCDERGCYYDAALRAAECSPRDLERERSCHVNPQGYPDDQSFTADSLSPTSYRILALGDSFTYGASASRGQSFVEQLEAELPDTIIWNTGIPGAGTNQALAVYRYYAPVMQPDLVLLGFYTNDFEDNLYPLDSYLFGKLADKRLLGIRQYRAHDDGSVTRIETQADFFYRYNRLEMPADTLTHMVGLTRTGTLVLNMLDAVRNILNQQGPAWQAQVNATRANLQALQEETRAQGIHLLVLLIPDRGSLSRSTRQYQAAQQLLNELHIACVNPYSSLRVDDYAAAPDDHWNDAGHQKAAQMLQSRIEQMQSGSTVSACETGAATQQETSS